jgi:GntR family transcriptional regulator
MANIDPNDPRPPYQQIAEDLRRSINAGDLAPGQRMASSRELAALYGVAPMTVHQAIRVLREEGLVDSWQGRGVFVRPADGEERPLDLPTQVEALQQRVDELSTQVTHGVAAEIAEIRRLVGTLQAHLLELYGRTGHSYPHDEANPKTAKSRGETRRKASGA